jgi:hypothetical protein
LPWGWTYVRIWLGAEEASSFFQGVRGTTTTTTTTTIRDSFRFDQRAARFGAAVPPMYLSTRVRALDARV